MVDTNVAVAADGRSSCSKGCAMICLERILEITNGKALLAIDDGWRVIEEYKGNIRQGGQRGVAETFLKWVLTNHKNPQRCHRVAIRPKDDDPDDFVEFPEHAGLAGFDRSDRKFVAVAAGHKRRPPVLQGTDAKWWGWRVALAECGITVEFLCAEEMREQYQRKFMK
ncbi:MAG: hypothetical protein ACLQU2_13500 [Candidatus Binataceae bacterium]